MKNYSRRILLKRDHIFKIKKERFCARMSKIKIGDIKIKLDL